MAAPTPSTNDAEFIDGSTSVTIRGQEVIIIFLFRRIAIDGPNYEEIIDNPACYNAHVAAIMKWIPLFDDNEPDIEDVRPSRTRSGKARPVKTLVVVAPYHIGGNKSEAAHITVRPANDFWGRGTIGTCHIYMDKPDGVYTNYLICKNATTIDRWSSPVMRRAIRKALDNRRPYPTSEAPFPAPPPAASGSSGPAPSSWADVAAGRKREAALRRYDLRPSTRSRKAGSLAVDVARVAHGRIGKRPRKYPRPPPRVVDGQEVWDVDGIVAARQFRGQLQYRVRWTGWPLDRTWYLAEVLKGVPEKLNEYHSSSHIVAEMGAPKLLTEWLRMAEQGRIAQPHEDDNKAALEWWHPYRTQAVRTKWA